jgi:hypothetical protein
MVGDRLGAEFRGRDGEVRLPVMREPRGQACGESFAVGEDRPFGGCGLREAAGDHYFERSIEKDDADVFELRECMAGGFSLDGSAAEGEYKVRGLGMIADGFGFKLAKGYFAALREELRNGASGAGFDDGVGIEKAPAELLSEQCAGGGFTRSHESGKHDASNVYRQIGLGPHAL